MATLEPLPYAYDALEPYIDRQTMQVHHDKHHQAYLDKFTAAIENYLALKKLTVEEILASPRKIPATIKTAVINNGGGHANHSLFWKLLKKEVAFKGEITAAINMQFENYEKFKEQFTTVAMAHFGSGWTWLVVDNKSKKLQIITTVNQDNPLSKGKVPILLLDLWEHAYYLKYQNRRSEYVEAFFHIINWEKVNELYIKAVQKNKI